MRRSCNLIPKLHLKKGDSVRVLSGKESDRGTVARVLQVYPKKWRALVEGINVITKHVKPNSKYPNGQIVKMEAPVHVSKLQVIDPKTGKPARVGRKRNAEGDWERYFKERRKKK